MGNEGPPKPPTQEEWIEMKRDLKRKKIGATQPRRQYSVEEVGNHLKKVEEENKGYSYRERKYLEGRIHQNSETKDLWLELGRFVEKVRVMGKNHENMVQINNLKSQTGEFLADILLKSNPDDWERNPLFYTELHRVIFEKLNPINE